MFQCLSCAWDIEYRTSHFLNYEGKQLGLKMKNLRWMGDQLGI